MPKGQTITHQSKFFLFQIKLLKMLSFLVVLFVTLLFFSCWSPSVQSSLNDVPTSNFSTNQTFTYYTCTTSADCGPLSYCSSADQKCACFLGYIQSTPNSVACTQLICQQNLDCERLFEDKNGSGNNVVCESTLCTCRQNTFFDRKRGVCLETGAFFRQNLLSLLAEILVPVVVGLIGFFLLCLCCCRACGCRKRRAKLKKIKKIAKECHNRERGGHRGHRGHHGRRVEPDNDSSSDPPQHPSAVVGALVVPQYPTFSPPPPPPYIPRHYSSAPPHSSSYSSSSLSPNVLSNIEHTFQAYQQQQHLYPTLPSGSGF